jgi:hypothetical protein
MNRPDNYDIGLDDGWSLAPIAIGDCSAYLRGYLAGIADADDECAAVGIGISYGSQLGKKRRYMISEARRLLRIVTSDDR